MGGILRFEFAFFDDFVMELFDLSAEEGENFTAFAGEGVLFTGVRIVLWLGFEPAVGLHASEHRIKSARTDIVSVMAEFRGNPLAVDWTLFGVMEDVNLPDAKSNLAVGCGEHLRLPYTTSVNTAQASALVGVLEARSGWPAALARAGSGVTA